MNFASDNHAGTHPEILHAINECNAGYAYAYGKDDYSKKAQELSKSIFGSHTSMFQVFSGSSANVLAIEPLLDRYGAILCSSKAHLHVDETGAPERILGTKVYSLETADGKITSDQINDLMPFFRSDHQPVGQVLSLTQATEYGTIYTLDELNDLGITAKKHGLKVHIDGARYANATASLNCDLKDIVESVGASSLSLGTNKNGGMFGEQIIFFNQELANNFAHRRKNIMQLNSKMRFSAIQFLTFFENNLWKQCASHANEMAQLLNNQVKDIDEIQITQQVETNAVFAIIPKSIIKALQEHAYFHIWDAKSNEVRWMCSWQTTEDEVIAFAAKINELIGAKNG